KKNPGMKIDMAQHQLVFLVRGDKAASIPEKELEKLQEKHLEHIFKMLDTKKAAVAGPFMEETDLRGIIVFQLGSVEEAGKFAEQDPAVKAGRLKLEIHPWWVAKGVWT
ncbi:MAG TPA: YciI family protein, partial [candidate division Zixibacteria bacterium]|nr:YciI family protein [candidate division Zixibacteria bacterium]